MYISIVYYVCGEEGVEIAKLGNKTMKMINIQNIHRMKK